MNQAAIRLCSLITSMIQPRDTRLTANEILTNGEMIAEMRTLETNKWKLDNGMRRCGIQYIISVPVGQVFA